MKSENRRYKIWVLFKTTDATGASGDFLYKVRSSVHTSCNGAKLHHRVGIHTSLVRTTYGLPRESGQVRGPIIHVRQVGL